MLITVKLSRRVIEKALIDLAKSQLYESGQSYELDGLDWHYSSVQQVSVTFAHRDSKPTDQELPE